MKNVVLILMIIYGLVFTESSLSQVDRKSSQSVNRELVNIHNDKYIDKYQYENQRNTITCKSRKGRRNHCRADTRYGVSFLKQISRSNCDYNWGYDDTGIWVDNGCSAQFSINYGWDQPGAEGNIIACSSYNYQRQYCQAYLDGREVFLLNQISDSSCINNWGYDRNGIWVSNGCRADFAVEDRSYTHDADITCSSRGLRFQSCPANTQGGVEFIRQLSRKSCNGNWGYDGRGIWVDNGCRATFRLNSDGNNQNYRDDNHRLNNGGLRPNNRNTRNNGRGSQVNNQQSRTLRCESSSRRKKTCKIPYGATVNLSRQLSKTNCNNNWGFNKTHLWVNNGCRAEFTVYQ